ncbi:MAG: hypothetical protein M3Z27_05585 [Actinomycetota bacterium]|nr:hypothetical protein [Actinomycetota bacterium]
MSTRVLKHLRSNVVAYLALFVALGGTSYAAISISGTQLRNHSVDAVKLNPRSISASIRAWAIVVIGLDGHSANVVAASGRVHASAFATGERITWVHRRFARNCMASATPQVGGGIFTGSVTAAFDAARGSLQLYGFGPDKPFRPQSASVMIVCP